MDASNPRFQTSPEHIEPSAQRAAMWWMKITDIDPTDTANPSGNKAVVKAVLCSPDGAVAGTRKYIVATTYGHSVGRVFLATAPQGGTKVQFSARAVPLMELPLVPAIFLVSVVKDGGSDGTATAAATWTYKVSNFGLTDGSLGNSITVKKARVLYGTTTTASTGLAYYNPTDNSLVLWDTDEKFASVSCT